MMKLEFKPENRTIVIDDAESQQKQLFNIILVCNLIVGILHFVDIGFANISVIDYFFIAMIAGAVGSLIYFNFFLSHSKEYSIEEIVKINSYTSFNRINYFLQLKNGKKRKLHFREDFSSIEKLKSIINEE